MKTKLIKGKVDILLVDGCTEAQYHEYKFGGMWLNQVRWKVVNFIDKLTEEQADGLVSVQQFGMKCRPAGIFDEPHETAIEALNSWITYYAKKGEVFNPKTTLIFTKQK